MNRYTSDTVVMLKSGCSTPPWGRGAQTVGEIQKKGFSQDAIHSFSMNNNVRFAHDRPCISCGKMFASEGKHNRMCNSCKTKARLCAV